MQVGAMIPAVSVHSRMDEPPGNEALIGMDTCPQSTLEPTTFSLMQDTQGRA